MIESPPKLSQKEFSVLSKYIHENYGILLPIEKKLLLETKLRKRLIARNITTFREYIDFVFSKHNDHEEVRMIDEVSTNKTSFFREQRQFDFMMHKLLPNFLKTNPSNFLKVWSCAASSGEEAYSTAITIEEFNSLYQRTVNYFILGTDISSSILTKAVNAVYKEENIQNIHLHVRQKYFLQSKDRHQRTVRVKPRLRANTLFRRLNLMDYTYSLGHVFDVIFCRNVLIYFDRPTQEKVIRKVCANLKPGGYLFLGHSESLLDKNTTLKQVGSFIYQKL